MHPITLFSYDRAYSDALDILSKLARFPGMSEKAQDILDDARFYLLREWREMQDKRAALMRTRQEQVQ